MWRPSPGPQTQAYECPADELFYGGAAGGGKSDLLLGLAGTKHTRSVIFRREFPQLRALIERSREVFNARGDSHLKDSFNEQLHLWRLHDGRLVEFSSMQFEKDKENQRGRDRDLHAWDEVTQFTESQFRFANAWNRSTKPGQRCQIVATGNPPTSSEGEWVIRYWAPWLDGQHPNPARPGELRWFVHLPKEKRDQEVPDSRPVTIEGEIVQPRSRTFIPARLTDNPILAATGYGAMLQGLPEPLRSQMLFGDFSVGLADDAWQVIPTAWVRAAQSRWTPEPPPGQGQTSLGADVAYGGADSTVPVARYGPWFSRPKKYQGTVTDSGRKAAHLILREHQGEAVIYVDAIGYGAACVEALKESLAGRVVAVNVAEATDQFDRSRKYRLSNVRALMYWRLREALDPETGDGLMLPPDPEVLADLTSVRYEVRASGIVLEEKKKLKERLGRSPDVGDAIALAHLAQPPLPIATAPDPAARSLLADLPAGIFGTPDERRPW